VLLAPAFAAADVANAVVRLIVTYQENDPRIPWQRMQPRLRAGYAVMIAPGRLITTEDLVRNSTLIEFQKPRRGEKFGATVEQADYQCNVAVLRVEDASALADRESVSLLTNMPDSDLEIVQFDETGAPQTGSASVQKTSVSMLPAADNVALTFTLQTDVNVNGMATPVAFGDVLAGLIIQYDRAAATALMLPYPVLNRFLDAAARSPYPGVASAGFRWSPLVDPAKRAYLGVPDDATGVLVLSTLPNTGAAESLRGDDVVVEWDGYPVDNLGFYPDPVFGRLLFPYMVAGRRQPGERAPVTVLRGGRSVRLDVQLIRRLDADSLIPENTTGAPAEYVVEGGLILRELTGDYLRAAGPKWELQASPRLMHLYLTRSQRPAKADEKIVILSEVLPDPVNVGYDNLRDEIVSRINGEAVGNMADVFRILDRDGHVERLTIQGVGVDIVLDRAQLDGANERIARTYHIPNLRGRRIASQ
jgi:S1-C subfamily serine protease